MIVRKWSGALLLCVLAPGAMPAQQKTLSAADQATLARVDAHYNHVRSLRVEFSQKYDGLGVHREERGTLLLSKPGRMRWSYSEPTGKLFVLDGKYAYSYAPGDAQAQRTPAKLMDDMRSPLRLLLGHTQLKRELQGISVEAGKNGLTEIAGRPVVAQSGWKDLRLEVNAAGEIVSIALGGEDGSSTTFSFQNEADDVPVSGTDFVFSPPIGVPIVDGTAPI